MARCFEVSEANAFHCPTPIEMEATSTDLARASEAFGFHLSRPQRRTSSRDSVTACDGVTARYRNNAAPARRPVAGPQEGA